MPNEWGITALYVAVLARRNSLETFQFLLNKGAVLNDSSVLLHLAYCFHSLEVIKFLHWRGIDVNQRCRNRSRIWDSCKKPFLDPSNKTPLKLILQIISSSRYRLVTPEKHYIVYEYLILNGSDVPLELLNMAITSTNIRLLSAALESSKDAIDRYQEVFGKSALSKALKSTRSGNKAKFRRISHLLLDSGAQV